MVTLDELLDIQRLAQPRFAPDGQTLAFTAASSFAGQGEGPRSRIALMSLGGALLRETGGAHDRLPRWSPDGARLAFLSGGLRPGFPGLHLVNLQSGAVAALGQVEGAVEDFTWSRDGHELLVLAEHAPPAPAGDAPGIDQPAGGPDPRVVRPGQSWQRLYRVVVATGQTTAVGPPDLSVWEFDWDGLNTVVAILSVDPSESGWYTAFLGLIDLVGGTVQVLHRPQWQLSSPCLSPDGTHVAFLEGICSDRGSLSGTVSVVSIRAATAEAVQLQDSAQLSPELEATSLGWINHQRLFYAGRCGLLSTCGTLSLGGVRDELWRGAAAVREVSASADGRWLAAVKETASEPAEIVRLEMASPTRWESISAVNSGLAGLALPLVEPLHWSAADGLGIEGLLVRPRESGPEERLPLVVLVHGGPTAAWSYTFPCGNRNAALLSEAGYAVLLPNPRGSSGRGQQFARAVVGDLGGAELSDTLSGVQACVDAGYADGERVGIMGASHGGFIAAWAPTQTTRFRAGVAVACVSDYLSLHYTSNIGGLDDILFIGPDRVADYLARSPIAYVDRCVTPMLIVHGEQDRCCPVSQAEELYGGLVENGVETELVIYPREGHGFVEREHQLDLCRRVHAWFNQHLAVRT